MGARENVAETRHIEAKKEDPIRWGDHAPPRKKGAVLVSQKSDGRWFIHRAFIDGCMWPLPSNWFFASTHQAVMAEW